MSSPPRATYRLQLRAGMDFARAAGLVSYLARLGISHLYLSPPFAAAPGSSHGYDIVDPNRFDPELGGEDGFMLLRRALDEQGLGLVLDIVPNHMGIGRANRWWWDVLRHGRDSAYAQFFDIDFAADPEGKLVLPVLGAPLAEVLERGELRVVAEDGEPLLAYGEQRFPVPAGTSLRADPLRLLQYQPYRLVFWREGVARRNYRRFFNIDQLAGLRAEEPEVFEASHQLILELARRELIQGLRVDHVDGLTDPKAYLDRLQRRLGEVRPSAAPFYVVVEKILIGEERLPHDWPIAGTTGYEFLNEILGLLVSRPGLDALAKVAERFIGASQDYAATVRAAKAEVLDKLFAGELTALARRASRFFGLEEQLAAATLRRILVSFPVYRTYGGGREWSTADVGVLEEAFDRSSDGADLATRHALDRLERRLANGKDKATTGVLQGLQQLSGPLMAKSVEDTAFYRYHRLLALNEIGGEADSLGCRPEEFHRRAAWRLQHWPDTMLATETHDTKRGEDGRARLAVLSEVPEEWEAVVTAWRELNASLSLIHPADEYAFYQSLVGAWPLELRVDDGAGVAELRARLQGWLLKALREGKERSDWNDPNSDYEKRAVGFLRASMTAGSEFLSAVAAFVARINAPAIANSLAQLLVKLTSPGIPDIYQGTEFNELSLVDPDNRRAVDFGSRVLALAEPQGGPREAKLAVLRGTLSLRARHPDLFSRGRYHPLPVEGSLARHVLAYGRVDGERIAITVITRLLGRDLLGAAASALDEASWGDTSIALPRAWPRLPWRDLFSGATVETEAGHLRLAPLLSRSPVALVATV